jgi:dienelactone hydrolase
MTARPLLLTLLLATAGTAGAQDACLTGASTLGDQRALATLRSDTEGACPCATATARGSWRRCAKAQLQSALAGATVRAECEKTAKAVIKGATCGTAKETCGRVQPEGKTVVSCRVKKASSCTDKTKYDQTACTEQTHCADVVDWTAGTCSDVRARGPFEAGARTIPMTKDSVANPGTPRVLNTVVWYPTTPGAGPIDGATNAVLNAPVDLSGGPYPVLLFSHGSCGYATQSIFLLPLIAARGYVVIAPPHPGNTFFEFPNCGTPSAQLASAQERPQDVIFALDEMLAANADPGSDFFGALDPTRIGMSGHSFGGFTTFHAVALDSRFKVAIPMAPATPALNNSLDVPSLMVLGNIDSVVNNPAARTAYANSVSPRYKVEIEHAGHYAFSNFCFPGPDCMPPTTLTQPEAHAQVLRWVIPFLEWHLKGDDTFAAFFEVPSPGVLFDAAP